MNGLLIIRDEDRDFVWKAIQDLQIVFHPSISPIGNVDYKKFFAAKREKTLVLFVDRNILSSLLRFCEKGSLKNKGESQIVGIIMAWTTINHMAISAGLAVRKHAAQLQSQEEGLLELQKFLEIFEFYPSPMWLEVAEGMRTAIPPITFTRKSAQNITVNYADAGDHYDMALASLLCIVRLYRSNNHTALEKLKAFFQWMYENLLISECLLVYAAMLFTGQDSIKAPKHANSDSFDKIVAGCENQAWDISYLTNWSTIYSDSDKYPEEYLFATNDVLLKRIFINTNAPDGFNGLIYDIFTKKEYNELMDYFEVKMQNRVKPDFGTNAHAYFQTIIDKEKRLLLEMLNTKE